MAVYALAGAAPGASSSGGPPGPGSPQAGSKHKEHERKQSRAGAYDGKKRALSIGYHSKDDDAYKFDQAFEANDLKAFVALLASEQPIESFEERMHPWAEDPTTVGTLAGTQLAILASVAEKENPSIKTEIREAGGIPALVSFLKSGQKDRVQTAVVALSFLTADSPENTVLAHQEGAMPELMKHLESPVAGMRAAAATTLRNMCVEGDKYRAEFVKLGGIKGLVHQLASTPDGTLNYADVQLEAVLNIQDLIEDEHGDLILDFALEALEHGVHERLQTLIESEDEEVRGSAQEVLNALDTLDEAAGGAESSALEVLNVPEARGSAQEAAQEPAAAESSAREVLNAPEFRGSAQEEAAPEPRDGEADRFTVIASSAEPVPTEPVPMEPAATSQVATVS